MNLENRFTYHPPKEGQPERYVAIRDKARELAFLIEMSFPASRECDTAIDRLDECVMWANASIARNE